MEAVVPPGALFGFARMGAQFTLVGELDAAEAPPFERAVHQLLWHGVATDVIVDATNLTFCDSVGLGVLVRLAEGLPQGCRVVVRGVQPQFRKLIRLSDLDHVLVVEGQPDEASGIVGPSSKECPVAVIRDPYGVSP